MNDHSKNPIKDKNHSRDSTSDTMHSDNASSERERDELDTEKMEDEM